jgi:hypothetical protein
MMMALFALLCNRYVCVCMHIQVAEHNAQIKDLLCSQTKVATIANNYVLSCAGG